MALRLSCLADKAACYNTGVEPIVIIDYGAGNLRSVQKAFEHLGHQAIVSDDPRALDAAPAVVFPGQGASEPAMAALTSLVAKASSISPLPADTLMERSHADGQSTR